ncbi:unnamed protein product [Prorocentrum cordatum]|uniref:Uncharacterized protein n=1 Tax=Prorocentrum cordatum TaxID=2364126 RepID=A0ABN9QA47_9DINO|nr:unnamed protein product [Polarella glacialis]
MGRAARWGVNVTALDAETQLVDLGGPPGRARVPEGLLEELQGKLAGLAEGERLVATLVGPDGMPILQAAEDGGEAEPAASGDAQGEAAEGEAAEGEAAAPEERLPTLAELRVVAPPPPEGEAAAAEDP